MTVTFEEIRKKAGKLEVRGDNLGGRIDHLLDSARINADDTVHIEKAEPAAEWERIALDSLGSLLSHSQDAKAQAWFRRAGFSW